MVNDVRWGWGVGVFGWGGGGAFVAENERVFGSNSLWAFSNFFLDSSFHIDIINLASCLPFSYDPLL